eukprot:5915933-Pleurochrysis_carterae.AAC.2
MPSTRWSPLSCLVLSWALCTAFSTNGSPVGLQVVAELLRKRLAGMFTRKDETAAPVSTDTEAGIDAE